MKIGMIGLGVMGKPMARNLAKAGYEVYGSDMNQKNLDAVAKDNVKASTNIEIEENCDVIITMLPNSPQVKQVVMAEDGLLDHAKEGTILIDMSSIAPLASREVHDACAKKGIRMLEAPVSGGEPKAVNGTLSIMCGGEEALFNEMSPILHCMGSDVVLCGASGAGNTTKLANQIIVAANIAAVAEGFMFQYAQMLYYAVYEKSAALQDVETYNEQITHSNYSAKSKADQFEKGSGRWNLEQEILYKVRNGDTNISDLMSRASASNRHSSDVSAKSISEAKRNVDQLLTLISRAAVEGGLPQKTSFSLCTEYRKQIDRCQSFGEVAMLSNDLLIDYIQRVKRMKTYAKCSVQIRLCIEYIENHLDEKITLNHLAKKIGYTSTYLSKLFNEEIGMVLTEFVQKEKINRAKFELTHTGKTIEEISYDLGFTTRSYFATVFRKYEKMSPKEYREKYEEF